jgi:3-phenylpropionate/trans-cinnamate dioxygenase ferredoxin subunit
MSRHVIARVDELPPGTRKFLTIDRRPIAVFNIKGEFFGLLNRCPHQGAALCEGPLIGLAQSSDPGEIEYSRLGEIIRCPWHGWEFDIRTGQSYCDPKRFRAKAYPVNVEPGASVVKGPYVAETIAVGRKRLRGGGYLIGVRSRINVGNFKRHHCHSWFPCASCRRSRA